LSDTRLVSEDTVPDYEKIRVWSGERHANPSTAEPFHQHALDVVAMEIYSLSNKRTGILTFTTYKYLLT
jgi:hypothetical protein